MNIIEAIEQDYKRDDIPEFGVGDTLKVYIKIKEGNRERIQMFEGFVLKIQNGGLGKTFTVRKISSGVGVEKTFPIHSPMIEKVEVTKRGAVRRAKLNYMRQRTGKAAKIKVKEEKKENDFSEGSRKGSFFRADLPVYAGSSTGSGGESADVFFCPFCVSAQKETLKMDG